MTNYLLDHKEALFFCWPRPPFKQGLPASDGSSANAQAPRHLDVNGFSSYPRGCDLAQRTTALRMTVALGAKPPWAIDEHSRGSSRRRTRVARAPLTAHTTCVIQTGQDMDQNGANASSPAKSSSPGPADTAHAGGASGGTADSVKFRHTGVENLTQTATRPASPGAARCASTIRRDSEAWQNLAAP